VKIFDRQRFFRTRCVARSTFRCAQAG
jgi:hypothetical protein